MFVTRDGVCVLCRQGTYPDRATETCNKSQVNLLQENIFLTPKEEDIIRETHLGWYLTDGNFLKADGTIIKHASDEWFEL